MKNLNIGRNIAYAHYREVRQEFLNCCLRVVKLMWPDALDRNTMSREVKELAERVGFAPVDHPSFNNLGRN